MNLELVTPPEKAEILGILSVALLKKNLRITNTAEDDIAEACILAAYNFLDGAVDGWLNRAILTQTWKLRLPGFKRRIFNKDRFGAVAYEWVGTNIITLPLPPLQSVTSVKYMVDGTLETLDTDAYSVVTSTLFGTVQLASNTAWPTGLDDHPEAVEIEFVCGYGDHTDVLERAFNIQTAMMLLASDRFRNREDTYAEPRLVAVNRQIINGVSKYAGRYRVPNTYA